MRSPNKTILVGAKLVIPIALLLISAVLSIVGQTPLERLPDNFRVEEQLGSPVAIQLRGVRSFGKDLGTLEGTVSNVSTREIRNIVLISSNGGLSQPITFGLPGTLVGSLGYELGLRPGGTRSFPALLIKNGPDGLDPKLKDGLILKPDLVLFQDGGSWGPDTAKQSEYIRGLYDGEISFLSKIKKMLVANDDTSMRELIVKDGPPAEIEGLKDRAKLEDGFDRGYYVARLGFRSDLTGRGDLNGVRARVRDMERELGLVPLGSDGRKQVTVRFGYVGEPIRITGFSFEGRDHAIDERFFATGDWISGLRFNIRNISGKTIKSVSFGIDFPETLNTGQMMGSSLQYGPHPITNVETDGQPRVIADGIFYVGVDEPHPGNLKKFIEKRQSFDTISRVFISLYYVDFEDGTRWSGGQYSKQDPDNPRRWIPIKPNL